MDSEPASMQIGASAPAYAGPPADFKTQFSESDAPSLHDGPALETCRRELEAVLASLDPETS